MTQTINLTPEAAKRVKAAKKCGLDVDAMLSRFFMEQLPDTAEEEAPSRPSHAELRAALDKIAEMGHGRGYLPPEAFDRENLYEDRS